MPTLSLCMIVKNEEKVLSRCLDSCKKAFDEIIIVDTGSTDKTKDIAKLYTDKIFDFIWVDDFSKARNYSFSKATSEYIMWLDADDIVEETDLEKLIELKKNLTKDIYMLKYQVGFDTSGNVTFDYYRERIFRSNKKYQWCDRVHEYVSLLGDIEYKDIAIKHQSLKNNISNRNLNIYKNMVDNLEEMTPRNLYYYGRELFDHESYKESIGILKLFLATKKGWVEDNINACHLLYYCYKQKNNISKMLESLYQTFQYDIPRRKTTCLIGDIFLEQSEYNKAIYWYKHSLTIPTIEILGFAEKDYDYFIPYINLCICYDKIGNIELAKKYHEKSKLVKPNDSAVLHNDKYFANLIEEDN